MHPCRNQRITILLVLLLCCGQVRAMMIRSFLSSSTRRVIHGSYYCTSRAFASSTTTKDLVHLDTTSHDGIAILTMQNPPVNSLSLEM
jgi:hypothetical protein